MTRRELQKSGKTVLKDDSALKRAAKSHFIQEKLKGANETLKKDGTPTVAKRKNKKNS